MLAPPVVIEVALSEESYVYDVSTLLPLVMEDLFPLASYVYFVVLPFSSVSSVT